MQYTIAAFIIIAGIVLLFFGWRIYKSLVSFLGFVVGVIAGAVLTASFIPSIILIFLGALIVGIAGALLFRFLHFTVFLLLGGLAGAFIGSALAPIAAMSFVQWTIIACFAIIGAVIALFMRKTMVIASTAIIGAGLIVKGFIQIMIPLGVLQITTHMRSAHALIAILILALLGAIIQVFSSKLKEKRK